MVVRNLPSLICWPCKLHLRNLRQPQSVSLEGVRGVVTVFLLQSSLAWVYLNMVEFSIKPG